MMPVQILKERDTTAVFWIRILQKQDDQLRETYVIFITRNDVLGSGLPIYHIDRTIEETGEKFKDEAHIIYVNSSIQDETKLGKLMQDFWCKRGEEMNYDVLAERVSFFKEKKEGVNQMCEILDEVKEEGKNEGKIELLVDLVKTGVLSISEAAKKIKMSEEEFKKYL